MSSVLVIASVGTFWLFNSYVALEVTLIDAVFYPMLAMW
jgi:hypothetical protein